MLLPDILIFALAVWRVSVLIAMEDGPYGFMKRIREKAGVEYQIVEGGDTVPIPLTGLGKMITCVWCVSFWATVVLSAVWWFDVNVIYVLGLWGAACAIQGIVMRE